jgi:hypothetical protein
LVKKIIILLIIAVIARATLAEEDTTEGLRTTVAQAPTPLEVRIVTSTPPPVDLSTPTTTFTPSPDVQSAAMLQAKQSAGEVNVRATPDIDGELRGKITYGTQYVVTGRYFKWYQFAYDSAPDGVAWVFDELVEVTGDISLIPDLSQTPQATLDPTAAIASQNALTPGSDLTATAGSREIVGPVAAVNVDGTTQADAVQTNAEVARTVLPTFTYPASIAMLATPEVTEQNRTEERLPEDGIAPQAVPPIVPIALLGVFGIFGLAISTLRR